MLWLFSKTTGEERIIMLSETLKATLGLYYQHRADHNASGPTYDVPWDKESDLDVIFAAAEKEGFNATAMAGTFWFSSLTENIRVNESNYLAGGESKPIDAPFGGMAELDSALVKSGHPPARFINANEHGGLEKCLKQVIIQTVDTKTERDRP
jgi:hypothetical protein